jgi:hypothetical protein
LNTYLQAFFVALGVGMPLVVVFLWGLGRAKRLERERIQREAAVVNFREGTAHNLAALHAMNQQIIVACQALVQRREPTHEEITHYLQTRNLWCGTTGDMATEFVRRGFVIITDDRWKQIVDRLGPGDGMTDQEWIDRKD